MMTSLPPQPSSAVAKGVSSRRSESVSATDTESPPSTGTAGRGGAESAAGGGVARRRLNMGEAGSEGGSGGVAREHSSGLVSDIRVP